MTNPFDADDLLKDLYSVLFLDLADEDVSSPVSSISNNSTAVLNSLTPYKRKYRTKQEIYNEIVCECAELEKIRFLKAQSVPNSAQMKSVACSTSEFMDMTINTCSVDPRLPAEHNSNKTIQNLVQLLVAAVKESGILNDQSGTNSSEDILKRKRLQNKKAAIRYRRRQKELREEAELELTILMNKNNEMKNEIKRMQAEIDQLKARVLQRTSEEA
ncbi:hypothetical protein DINM_021520 [Dirofilaria immitis]|nr:hypothetical protein [Dirofilaria immitis]